MASEERQALLDEARELGLVAGEEFPKNITNADLAAKVAATRANQNSEQSLKDSSTPSTEGDGDAESSSDDSILADSDEEVVESKPDGSAIPIPAEVSVADLPKPEDDAEEDEKVPSLVQAGGKPEKLYSIEGITAKERRVVVGGTAYYLQKDKRIDVPRHVRNHLVENAKTAVDVRPPV